MSRLLWVDCLGGLLVGLIVIAFCSTIATWDNLPLGVVLLSGIANIVYGAFSLSLTLRSERPLNLLSVLAIANVCWFFVCCTLTAIWWDDISVVGIIHLIGEGVYVGMLGCVEWRYRESLRSA